MDENAIKYTFKIEDFTPETMPFGRLVKYYAEIIKMIGVAEYVHLMDVVESSHGSGFAVDRNHELALIERLTKINDGSAPTTSLRAQSAINNMLKEDGTSGIFSDSLGKNIITFPGKRASDNVLISMRDTATFSGELYHISGTKDDVKIRIATEAFGVVFCTTTRDIGKALRDFLFEDIKVSGRGMWTKDEKGKWNIDDFMITDYAPVKNETLRQAVDRIRALEVNWPDDPLGDIREFEEKNESVQ